MSLEIERLSKRFNGIPAVGLTIGSVLGFGLDRLMRATMLGVTHDAPLILFCMPLVLAEAVAIAVYIPARVA